MQSNTKVARYQRGRECNWYLCIPPAYRPSPVDGDKDPRIPSICTFRRSSKHGSPAVSATVHFPDHRPLVQPALGSSPTDTVQDHADHCMRFVPDGPRHRRPVESWLFLTSHVCPQKSFSWPLEPGEMRRNGQWPRTSDAQPHLLEGATPTFSTEGSTGTIQPCETVHRDNKHIAISGCTLRAESAVATQGQPIMLVPLQGKGRREGLIQLFLS